jgi:hypothetical protein
MLNKRSADSQLGQNPASDQSSSFEKISEMFCPPKPKLLDSVRRTGASRAWFGT